MGNLKSGHICHKYHKCGHFWTICWTKSVKLCLLNTKRKIFVGVIEKPSPLVIPTISSRTDPWTVCVLLNDHLMESQELPWVSYKKTSTRNSRCSIKAIWSLVNSSWHKLQVCGHFSRRFTYQNNNVWQNVYVVKGLRKLLIGRPAITALQLICFVNTVDSFKQKAVLRYPIIFKGVGTIEGEYNIVLKKDATPHALSTPQSISCHWSLKLSKNSVVWNNWVLSEKWIH